MLGRCLVWNLKEKALEDKKHMNCLIISNPTDDLKEAEKETVSLMGFLRKHKLTCKYLARSEASLDGILAKIEGRNEIISPTIYVAPEKKSPIKGVKNNPKVTQKASKIKDESDEKTKVTPNAEYTDSPDASDVPEPSEAIITTETPETTETTETTETSETSDTQEN